jgi:hypothetical protein
LVPFHWKFDGGEKKKRKSKKKGNDCGKLLSFACDPLEQAWTQSHPRNSAEKQARMWDWMIILQETEQTIY